MGTAENDHNTGNVSSDSIVFYGGQDCLLPDYLTARISSALVRQNIVPVSTVDWHLRSGSAHQSS
jgi:hypothetical protein